MKINKKIKISKPFVWLCFFWALCLTCIKGLLIKWAIKFYVVHCPNEYLIISGCVLGLGAILLSVIFYKSNVEQRGKIIYFIIFGCLLFLTAGNFFVI